MLTLGVKEFGAQHLNLMDFLPHTSHKFMAFSIPSSQTFFISAESLKVLLLKDRHPWQSFANDLEIYQDPTFCLPSSYLILPNTIPFLAYLLWADIPDPRPEITDRGRGQDTERTSARLRDEQVYAG